MDDKRFRYRMRFSKTMAVLLVLTGCAQQADKKPSRTEEAVSVPAAAATKATLPVAAVKPAAVREYRVDAAASHIWIFVYRKGNLSRLGHDHVISAGNISGRLLLADNIASSELDLSIPVLSLVVDDPAVRQQAGLESDSQPAEKDIASTRRGMLGARVLNAERFGVVKAQAKVAGGTLPELELDLIVSIRGVEQQYRSPVKVEKTTERITASGSFKILQSDFGMQPFSVLAGALAVKDELKIQYRIVARHW